jgi:hypothetical protein
MELTVHIFESYDCLYRYKNMYINIYICNWPFTVVLEIILVNIVRSLCVVPTASMMVYVPVVQMTVLQEYTTVLPAGNV